MIFKFDVDCVLGNNKNNDYSYSVYLYLYMYMHTYICICIFVIAHMRIKKVTFFNGNYVYVCPISPTVIYGA